MCLHLLVPERAGGEREREIKCFSSPWYAGFMCSVVLSLRSRGGRTKGESSMHQQSWTRPTWWGAALLQRKETSAGRWHRPRVTQTPALLKDCQESLTLLSLRQDLSLLSLAVPSPWHFSHMFTRHVVWRATGGAPNLSESRQAMLGAPFARLQLFIQQCLPTRWSSKCSDLWWLPVKFYLEKLIVG